MNLYAAFFLSFLLGAITLLVQIPFIRRKFADYDFMAEQDIKNEEDKTNPNLAKIKTIKEKRGNNKEGELVYPFFGFFMVFFPLAEEFHTRIFPKLERAGILENLESFYFIWTSGFLLSWLVYMIMQFFEIYFRATKRTITLLNLSKVGLIINEEGKILSFEDDPEAFEEWAPPNPFLFCFLSWLSIPLFGFSLLRMYRRGEILNYSHKLSAIRSIWKEIDSNKGLSADEVKNHLKRAIELGLPNVVSWRAREIIESENE